MNRTTWSLALLALSAVGCDSGMNVEPEGSSENALSDEKPDFIIVDLKMQPPNPVPGDNVTLTMTVENIGGDSPAGQYLSGAFFVNGVKSTWSAGNNAPLPKNGYRDLVADGGPFNGGSNLYRWGNYAQTVTAVVNDVNGIEESNTDNNGYTKVFQEEKLFYGINGHWDYPISNPDLLKMLTDQGVTNYRINTGTSAETIARAASVAKDLIAGGIHVLPVLDCGIFGGDEDSAFAGAYQLAVQMVLAFQGLGIHVYEVGNELDRQGSLYINKGAAGNKTEDYYASGWPAYRGTVRGLIEGVHAAQWDAQAGIDFVGADIAAADMLWDGSQPDGSTGYKTARWDVTMWHNYEVYLSIFNIGVDGGGTANPPLNIPEHAKRYNNNPFWLTEFGPNTEDSPDEKAAFLSGYLPSLWNNRINDNIGAIFVYQLDGEYGMIVNDKAVPIAFLPEYYAYQDFIRGHRE